jgi:hypothetical protein
MYNIIRNIVIHYPQYLRTILFYTALAYLAAGVIVSRYLKLIIAGKPDS